MSDIKLLSCPICGREVYIGTEDYDDNIEDVIVCDHCNLRFYGSYPATKQDLAEEWNTRKPMERILNRLEEGKAFYKIRSLDQDEIEVGAFIEAIDVVKEEGGLND